MVYGSLKKRQGVLKKEEKDSIKSGIANPLQHQIPSNINLSNINPSNINPLQQENDIRADS